MSQSGVPECEECGEHHRDEAECPALAETGDEWDTTRASAITGKHDDYSYLDGDDDAD